MSQGVDALKRKGLEPSYELCQILTNCVLCSSCRNRTKRGEYMVKIDSDQTLKQLKIQVYKYLQIDLVGF